MAELSFEISSSQQSRPVPTEVTDPLTTPDGLEVTDHRLGSIDGTEAEGAVDGSATLFSASTSTETLSAAQERISVQPPTATRLHLNSLFWSVGVYTVSRLVLLATALVVGYLVHVSLGSELSAFDGVWYLKLVAHGYPHIPLKTQSTLGFLPLYPMAIWATARLLSLSPLDAGLVVSGVGGLVSALLIKRLAAGWWGERTARYAVLAFLFFPGSVVFSMVYSEGLLIPLMVGCLLALRSRRFILAGILASLAGIVEPVGLVAIPVCLLAALYAMHRSIGSKGHWYSFSGYRGCSLSTARPLLAPALSTLGIGGFAIYLWVWTGTPFAAYDAQYYGWHQHSDPFRLVGHALMVLLHGLSKLTTLHLRVHLYAINLNLVNGLLGAVFIVIALVMLFKSKRELSVDVLAWTVGIAFLTFLSLRTPPNARMIIAAFPATLIWARRLRKRRFVLFLTGEALLLVLMSGLTFAGLMRP